MDWGPQPDPQPQPDPRPEPGSEPDVLRTVADLASDLAGGCYCSAAAIGRLGEVTGITTHGIARERRTVVRAHTGGTLLDVVTAARTPVRARLADDPCLVTLPRDHGAVPVMGVPLVLDDEVRGAVWVARRASDALFGEPEERRLQALAAQAALALDAARLRREATAWEPVLDTVKSASYALLGGRATAEVLDFVAQAACTLLQADRAVVSTRARRRDTLVVEAVAGDGAGALLGLTYPLERSVAVEAMLTRRPRQVNTATDGRRESGGVMAGLGPAVFVPLMISERALGTLAVGKRVGRPGFSPSDLLALRALAAEAAVALEYEHIRKELDRLALLEERERIAMELHDGVVQALFVVGLSLQAAEEEADDAEETRLRLKHAIGSIDGAIGELRNYIFGLRPDDLGDRHLEGALRELVDAGGRSGRVKTAIELDAHAAAALATRAPTVIQAAREALSNAIHHSGGTLVELRFYRRDGEVLLEVEDDGTGFDYRAPDGSGSGSETGTGHGLRNLRARAAELNGRFEVESAPGRGTCVRIRVPIVA